MLCVADGLQMSRRTLAWLRMSVLAASSHAACECEPSRFGTLPVESSSLRTRSHEAAPPPTSPRTACMTANADGEASKIRSTLSFLGDSMRASRYLAARAHVAACVCASKSRHSSKAWAPAWEPSNRLATSRRNWSTCSAQFGCTHWGFEGFVMSLRTRA